MPHHAKSLTSASGSSPGSTSVSVAAITAASVSPSDREAHLKPHKTPRKRAEKSTSNPLPFFATLNPPLSSKYLPADSAAKSAKHCAVPASPWHHHLSSNALAGAAAGALVSCCLHPVDTVKTVLQAEMGGTRRFVPAVTKILRERGVSGMYRGLTANLVTSAPISAIYTSTYEAVKEALLPHMPPGWTAVAHCLAGGAASMSTSLVFTPSEAVKQRLQLSQQYSTSWSALTGMVRSEGIASLYNGLGAVLCRNVPQSVLKFLTYEAMKGWALKDKTPSQHLPPGTQGGRAGVTWQLLIGGIAGSTAAFVTTPFDVIKTRMQSQSGAQYRGVVDALCQIWVQEGASGLYRGLIPRLLIYMSQGAIFFASYEILKRLLAQKQLTPIVRQNPTLVLGSHQSALKPTNQTSAV